LIWENVRFATKNMSLAKVAQDINTAHNNVLMKLEGLEIERDGEKLTLVGMMGLIRFVNGVGSLTR
jgi:hypothetical protein